MIIGFKFQSIKTIQAVIRTNPNKPGSILINVIDMAVGQALLQTVELIGIRQNRGNKQTYSQ